MHKKCMSMTHYSDRNGRECLKYYLYHSHRQHILGIFAENLNFPDFVIVKMHYLNLPNILFCIVLMMFPQETIYISKVKSNFAITFNTPPKSVGGG